MKPNRCVWLPALCVLLLGLTALQVGCPRGESPPEPAEPAGETATQPEIRPLAEPPTEPTTEPADEPAKGPSEGPTVEPAAEPPKAPPGLPALPVPDDNRMTAEKVELGKMLYFDTRLSKDGTISCATCHDPKLAWAEHRATSKGINDQIGGRNAPTVINAAYAPAQFWDGRAASLEEQALGPVANPIEMGHELDAMVRELSQLAGYKERFQRVFGTDVSKEGVAKAIAAFERTILSGNSPYDKFKAGDEGALTEAQKRGMELFEDAGCSTCHAPPIFSNYRYYNAGVGMDKTEPDQGRKDVTGKDSDLGKFRTPALREAVNTGPYFHDGSVATLEEAVALMAAGGLDNPNLGPMLKAVRRAELSAQDQKDLVEFLGALSGKYPIVEPPALPK